MRRLLPSLAVLAAGLACAGPAYGHAAFAGAEPAPGDRLDASPPRITLTFTEPLNLGLARAAATRDLETGPLARAGWLRILARCALYGTVLVLLAALLLPALIRRPRGWPVPEPPPARRIGPGAPGAGVSAAARGVGAVAVAV